MIKKNYIPTININPILKNNFNSKATLKITREIEKACVETVVSGMMTKDLALLVGKNTKWLNTKEFIKKVKEKIN